jgi:membrane-bound serine protease (ClpP class)
MSPGLSLRGMRRLILAAMAVLLLPVLPAAQPNRGGGLVIVAEMNGPIMPPTTQYIARALRRAEREGATCLLVEMNTPGGRGDAMRDIASLFLNAKVPVVVYVTPSGAQAASAGAVVALASNVLAMSPGTNIGAAKPVGGEGENLPSDMRDKVVNDMAAFTRSLAQKRGRDVVWSQDIIRKGTSISETEALKMKVAEYIAANRADLFRQINGRKVETAAGPKVLATLGARVEPEPLTWLESFLGLLFTPNVAMILAVIALYGIMTEVQNPGAIFPGVAGSIAFILTLYVFSVLSASGTGIALLLLSVILFAVDVYAPTHGVLTAGGIVAFVAGALMLFNPSVTGAQISLSVVITLALLTALFFGTIVTSAYRSYRRPPGSGPETLLGTQAEARTAVNPNGKVFADGAFWNAVNVGVEPIRPGDSVVIEARDGLTLKVRRAGPTPAEPIWSASAPHEPGEGQVKDV